MPRARIASTYIRQLRSGIRQLRSGTRQLRSGIRQLRSGIRRLEHKSYNCLMDGLDAIDGSRPTLVPSRSLNYNSGFFRSRHAYVQEFNQSGNEIVEMLKEYGGLRPDHKILDVGCGIGRVAAALTNYLDEESTYDGFDIVRPAIEWCQRTYAEQHPRFHFHRLDIAYGRHQSGRLAPNQVRFPFESEYFDFVTSISLFTHMRPQGVEHYLSEIHRVLVPGGTCLNTFFILDDFARRALDRRKTTHRFPYHGEDFYAKSGSDIENGVAYDEVHVQRMHENKRLTIVGPIRFGSWTGRQTNRYLYQDVVVARKHP